MSDDWSAGGFCALGPGRARRRAASRRSPSAARSAKSWWARRWIAVLEALQLGGRLARGRSYARAGQVLDLAIEAGLVHARVQGSRTEPYDVTIRMKSLSGDEWRRLAEVLTREAVFAGQAPGGRDAPGHRDVPSSRRVCRCFPRGSSELKTACSCPDLSNPCKHIAAVYYLLGEEFDRDPFLIFRLRGTTREDLLRVLDEIEEAAHLTARAGDATEGDAGEGRGGASAHPLPPNASFWRAGAVPEDVFPERITGQHPGALLLRLGAFPFWRGPEPLPDALVPVYERAATAALEVLADLARKG